MWWVIYIVLIALGFFFIILAIRKEDNPFWNMIGALISCVIWMILMFSGMQLEFPYQFYNYTTEAVELGYNIYSSPISPYLTYVFMLFFIITFIYFLAMVWDKWYNYKNPF